MLTHLNTIKLVYSKRFFVYLCCLVCVSCTTLKVSDKNQKTTTYTIDDTITLKQVTDDIEFLASDELQGRGNFNGSINRAANFIASRFKDIGLSPLQDQANYLQPYKLQRIVPKSINVTINGKKITPKNLALVTSAEQFNWQSSATSPESAINGLTTGVTTTFIDKDTNMRKALKVINNQGGSHIVLLDPKHQKSFHRYQSYFSKGSLTLVDDRNNSQSAGGTIVMVLTDIKDIEQYQINGDSTISNVSLNNVVGVLPGRSKPNEIVIYSAHYDHLGVKNNTNLATHNTDEIYNGANDNASGVAAVLSLANHFKKLANNERTIIFSAFSGEELGGFGSRYFSKQLNPNQVTAMINIEMIGKPAIFGEGTVWMTGMEHSTLGEQLNQALADSSVKVFTDPYPNENLFYRSDNATLARLGVPAHSFSSTQLDKDTDYHQTSDNFDTLDIPSMIQIINTLAKATTPLVTGKLTPQRITPKKLKLQGKIY